MELRSALHVRAGDDEQQPDLRLGQPEGADEARQARKAVAARYGYAQQHAPSPFRYEGAGLPPEDVHPRCVRTPNRGRVVCE
eukprot:gene19933-46494_t